MGNVTSSGHRRTCGCVRAVQQTKGYTRPHPTLLTGSALNETPPFSPEEQSTCWVSADNLRGCFQCFSDTLAQSSWES